MKVGLPSAGEQLSYSSSQVVITYFINMLGVEALADFSAGVYLDSRFFAAALGYDSGEQLVSVCVAPMRALVALGGLDAGVEQPDLEGASGGGVAGLVGLDGFAQVFEQFYLLHKVARAR